MSHPFTDETLEQHITTLMEHFSSNEIDDETSAFLIETIINLINCGVDLKIATKRVCMFIGIPMSNTLNMQTFNQHHKGDLDLRSIRTVLADIGLNEDSANKWLDAFIAVNKEHNKVEIDDDDDDDLEDIWDDFNEVKMNAIYLVNISSIVSMVGNPDNMLNSVSFEQRAHILQNPKKYWLATGYDTRDSSSAVLLNSEPFYVQDYYGGPTFGLSDAEELFPEENSETCSVWKITITVFGEPCYPKAYLVVYDND